MGLFKPNINKMRDKKDVKGLVKALKDNDANIRQRAVEALGETGEIESLVQVLKEAEDTYLRLAAVRALGRIGDTRAVGPLVDALSDKHGLVRSAAAEELGKIKDTSAVEPLCDVLRVEEFSDVRDNVVWALGEIKDVRAVGTLIWDMRRGGGWYSRGGPQEAIVSIGKPAVAPLAEALKSFSLARGGERDDAVFYSRVIDTLALIGEPAMEALNQALEHRDENVREAAKEALQKIRARGK